ncbi:HD domain-containing phosphohydrolase [Chitinibacteraceae bacterium HSL-7]
MTPPTTQDFNAPFRIALFDLISALSTALDLLDPALGSHQKRTCLIAAQIARTLGVSGSAYQDVYGAAIFHDIGAIGLKERLAMLDFDDQNAHQHAQLGAQLLSRFSAFSRYAPLVRFHHVRWENGSGARQGEDTVPQLSHLIYLADRIEVLAQGSTNILGDVPDIRQRIIDGNGVQFHPMFVDAFLTLSTRESFWLDLFSNNLDRILMSVAPFDNIDLDLDDMLHYAHFFALVIDSRSHFTATHSAGVAATAATIARHIGMSSFECTKMRMAGYLHDLGKLAIPSELIERHGGLEPIEMAKMRTHSYLTLDVLSMVRGLEDVAEWAACHHERLDGSGYPFHKTAGELSLGARIMAVADVYTALTEHRPYRSGMQRDEVLAHLEHEVTTGRLDPIVVGTLHRHITEVEQDRLHAQADEGHALEMFWRDAAPRKSASLYA